VRHVFTVIVPRRLSSLSEIMAPEIIDRKFHVDGYIYPRSRVAKGRVYWDCRLLRSRTCTARTITSDPAEGGQLQVYKRPEESKHSHPPNREEVVAEVLITTLKRKAVENPAEPPARLLRTELQGTTSDVLSQLPAQPALLRTIRRTRENSCKLFGKSKHNSGKNLLSSEKKIESSCYSVIVYYCMSSESEKFRNEWCKSNELAELTTRCSYCKIFF